MAGIGAALWALSRHAYIAEVMPAAQRGRALSLFGSINRAGIVAGPAVGGACATLLGLSASFIAASMLAFGALLLSLLLLKPTPRNASGLAHSARWSLVGKLLRTHWRDLLSVALAMTLGQMIRAGRHLIIPLYGAQRLGLDAAQISLAISVGARSPPFPASPSWASVSPSFRRPRTSPGCSWPPPSSALATVWALA